jgi:hypothetical protein
MIAKTLQANGQQFHDRDSSKEPIRTIVDAPRCRRSSGFGDFPLAAIALRAGKCRFPGWIADVPGMKFGAAPFAALTDGNEGQAGAVRPFRTCLPVGCVVDIALDADTVASLRAGTQLDVIASADGGQEIVFSISLAGFANAHDRMIALVPWAAWCGKLATHFHRPAGGIRAYSVFRKATSAA